MCIDVNQLFVTYVELGAVLLTIKHLIHEVLPIRKKGFSVLPYLTHVTPLSCGVSPNSLQGHGSSAIIGQESSNCHHSIQEEFYLALRVY